MSDGLRTYRSARATAGSHRITRGSRDQTLSTEPSVVSFTAGPGPPSYGDAVSQVTSQVQYAPQPLPPGQPMYVFMGQAPGVAGQPLQPVPYMISGVQPFAPTPPPNYPGPHSFLIITVTVAVMCAILNVTSLALGVPAIICAVMSQYHSTSSKDYPTAKAYGKGAVILMVVMIMYTLILGNLIMGLSIWGYYNPDNEICEYYYVIRDDRYSYTCD